MSSNCFRVGSATDRGKKSAPLGTSAFIFVTIVMPTTFPNINSLAAATRKRMTFRDAAKRLDLLGALLSIAASVALVFSLQQGGTQYSWRSATIVTPLVLSAGLWVSFLTWQWWIDTHFKGPLEPIFPWRLAGKRFYMGMLLYVVRLLPDRDIQLIDRPTRLTYSEIRSSLASHSTS